MAVVGTCNRRLAMGDYQGSLGLLAPAAHTQKPFFHYGDSAASPYCQPLKVCYAQAFVSETCG